MILVSPLCGDGLRQRLNSPDSPPLSPVVAIKPWLQGAVGQFGIPSSDMNTCEDPLLSYENKLDYNLCLIIHYFDIRKPLNLPVERSKLKFCETVKLSNPKNPHKEEQFCIELECVKRDSRLSLVYQLLQIFFFTHL